MFALLCFTTPRPIAGSPLKRTCLRTSCGPTSTRATSLSFTDWPFTLAMIMFSKSAALRSSPRLRTVNSASSDSRRPDGMSTFSRWSAAAMSAMVADCEARRRLSIQTRIE